MKTVVAVTTTERPSSNYLTATIAQIEAAGGSLVPAENKILYCDGPVANKPPGWLHFESAIPQGSRDSLWAVLKIAQDRRADLIVFEDDVILCKNAVPAMLACTVPADVGFLSFFDMLTPEGHPPGLFRYKADGDQVFWGAQAVKIPFRSLEYLLRTDIEVITPRNQGRRCGRDYAMQHFIAQSPYKNWGTIFPHWAQHVGDVSMVRSPRAIEFEKQGLRRDSKNFDPDYDALLYTP